MGDVLQEIKNDIELSLFALRSGGAILYPTDTKWGLGCDATDDNAINHLIEVKKSSVEKSFSVLVNDIEMLESIVGPVSNELKSILEEDRPTTIIYPKAIGLSKLIEKEDGSISVRVVKDEFCRVLIEAFKSPIISTSANHSGKDAPLIFSEVGSEILKEVDHVVKWRQDDEDQMKPSRIIKVMSDNEMEIIRK